MGFSSVTLGFAWCMQQKNGGRVSVGCWQGSGVWWMSLVDCFGGGVGSVGGNARISRRLGSIVLSGCRGKGSLIDKY